VVWGLSTNNLDSTIDYCSGFGFRGSRYVGIINSGTFLSQRTSRFGWCC
jgi:hypothetical protein